MLIKPKSVLNSEQIPISKNDNIPILKNQRSYVMFLSSLKTEATKTIYDYGLSKYMKFHNIKDYDSLLKIPQMDTQRMVEDYLLSLDLSCSSIKLQLNAIKAFYAMNDVILNWYKLFKLLPEQNKRRNDQPYTTEMIQKLVSHLATPKWKAIIHFLSASGCRIGMFKELKMKHLEDMPNGCKSVVVYADSKEEYLTFIHHEAVNALNEYFDERRKKGEEITPESWVFPGRFGKKISSHSVSSQMSMIANRLLERGELKGHRYNVAVLHGIRKRWNTIMKDDDSINKSHAEKMMGHSTQGIVLDSVYHKPTVERLFTEYQKAIPQLVIDDSYRLEISLEESKNELKQLQDDKDRKILALENQMFEIQKNLAEYVKRINP